MRDCFAGDEARSRNEAVERARRARQDTVVHKGRTIDVKKAKTSADGGALECGYMQCGASRCLPLPRHLAARGGGGGWMDVCHGHIHACCVSASLTMLTDGADMALSSVLCVNSLSVHVRRSACGGWLTLQARTEVSEPMSLCAVLYMQRSPRRVWGGGGWLVVRCSVYSVRARRVVGVGFVS
jgi:hypothetical protein